ncbi:unnamed protein product, partial [marine sediment metagenome]
IATHQHFADDDYSSAIALKTLELIDDDLLIGVRRKGKGILKKLEGIKDRFPDIIKGVRGSGLMLGIEFKAIDRLDKGFLLRFLSSQDDLTKWIAGYLLNEHRVRVLPMLSSPFTLRLQPSAMISDADIAQMIHALEDVCFRLQTNDVVGLSRFLMSSEAVEKSVTELVIPRESPKFFAYRSDRFWKGEKDSRKPRVAWLCHLIDTHDFVTLEPGMANVDAEKCEALLARGASHAGPIVMSTVDIESPAGGEVKLYSILLPVTSSWFKARMDACEFGLARALVQQGVDLASSLGCDVTSLGQYTS